jgi:hypothetical protein
MMGVTFPHCPLSQIFALRTPNSTGTTVPLNAAIVNPNLDVTLGIHPSTNRSSVSMGVKSATIPPKIVSMVDELLASVHLPPARTKNNPRIQR